MIGHSHDKRYYYFILFEHGYICNTSNLTVIYKHYVIQYHVYLYKGVCVNKREHVVTNFSTGCFGVKPVTHSMNKLILPERMH